MVKGSRERVETKRRDERKDWEAVRDRRLGLLFKVRISPRIEEQRVEGGASGAKICCGRVPVWSDRGGVRFPGHRGFRKGNLGSRALAPRRGKAGERANWRKSRRQSQGPARRPECRARFHRLRAIEPLRRFEVCPSTVHRGAAWARYF